MAQDFGRVSAASAVYSRKVSVRSSRDDLVKNICPILFGGFDGEVLVTVFDMRYFCAHVVSGTSFAGGLVLGSGTWIFAALPGGRRALRAVLRRRRAGLAVAVRARAAAGGGTAPRRDRLARQGAVPAAAVRDRSGQAGGGAGRGGGGSPRGAGGAVAARRGRAAEAAAGGGGRGRAQAGHDRLAAHGGRDPANPHRGARGGACEASRESGGACQGAVRAQERAPGAGGVGPSARPTGRRRRPWSHAQAGSRKARGSSQPRGGRARLLRLRETVCGERLRHVGTDRGVRQGAHARDRAPALAPNGNGRRVDAGLHRA